MSKPVIDSEGNKRWYNDVGQYHRLDGPAVEWWNGRKAWWSHGKLHREDGPAVEHVDGSKFWYLNGKRYTEEEFALLQFVKGINIYA